MRCSVYRSATREFTYLYLADTLTFDDLPDALRSRFGEPEAIMRLDLESTPKLANADVDAVRSALDDQGFYLQLPPEVPVEEEISRRFR
jgi:uncharacterized protein YcgL (UPF0745 family)